MFTSPPRIFPATEARHDAVVSGERSPGRLDPGDIRPTLVLGIGGAGHCVANQFKRILREVSSDGEPAHVRVLAMDTSGEKPKGAILTSEELIYISPPEEADYLRYKRDITNTDVAEWITAGEVETIEYLTDAGEAPTPGARGTRQFGRLCLYHSMDEVQTKLFNAIELTLGAALQRSRPANIVVVASAGGGTGTGTLIDVLFLIRECIRRYREDTGKSKRDVPVYRHVGIILGDALAIRSRKQDAGIRNQTRANTYALLKELDAFVSGGEPFTAKYPNGPAISEIQSNPVLAARGKMSTPEPGAPTTNPMDGEGDEEGSAEDRVLANQYLLFDARRDISGVDDPALSDVQDWESYTDEIAYGFMQLCVEPFAGNCEAKIIGNPPKGHFIEQNAGDGRGHLQRQRGLYSSFGLAEVHLPGPEIQAQMSRLVALRALKVLKTSGGGSDGAAWNILWEWMCDSFTPDLGSGLRDAETSNLEDMISRPGPAALEQVVRSILRRYASGVRAHYEKAGAEAIVAAGESLSGFPREAENDVEKWLRNLRIGNKERVFSRCVTSTDDVLQRDDVGALYSRLNSIIRTQGPPAAAATVERLIALFKHLKSQTFEHERDFGDARSVLRDEGLRTALKGSKPKLPKEGLWERVGIKRTNKSATNVAKRQLRTWTDYRESGLQAAQDLVSTILAIKLCDMIIEELQQFARMELTDLDSLLESTAAILKRDYNASRFTGAYPADHRRLRGLDDDDVKRMLHAIIGQGDSALTSLASEVAEDFRGSFKLRPAVADGEGVPFEDIAQEYQRDRGRRDELCEEMAAALLDSAHETLSGKALPNPEHFYQRPYLDALRRCEERFGEPMHFVELGHPRFLEEEAVLSRGNADELYDRVSQDLRLSMPPVTIRAGSRDGGAWGMYTALIARTGFRTHASTDDPQANTEALWTAPDGGGLGPHMGQIPQDLYLSEHPHTLLKLQYAHHVPIHALGNLGRYREAYEKHREGNLELLHIRREYAHTLPEITMNSPKWVPGPPTREGA